MPNKSYYRIQVSPEKCEGSHQWEEFISHSTKRIPNNSNAPDEIKESFTSTFIFSFVHKKNYY